MLDLLLYVLLLAILALAVLAAVWLVRGNAGGRSAMVALFGERPEKRLAIVEHASVDGRRRLVLIRRDDVEHLIMTGGPVDVVIETGIGAASAIPESAGTNGVTAPVFNRQARTFGRAAKPAEATE
ncbi:MAG: flagellar biosynthetic protein FliO [Hyphomicrobiaceae bacterium]|nr:flagellar biosynthetic protein FliO [Hyphomicrobiaceae bacterium]